MIKRRHQASGLALIAYLSIALSGCSSNNLASVTGSVTYKGTPAKGASVHFHREGATPEEEANFPIGMVDEEGNFELETADVGWGAVPGKYKVLVRWPSDKKDPTAAPVVPKNKRGRKAPAPSPTDRSGDPGTDSDRLGFRYFKLQQPLLSAEVNPGTNKLAPFELKD